MELLIKEGEIRENTRKIRRFYNEIDDTYDKNLDNVLDNFIQEYDLEGSEIESYSRKLIKYIKESNNIK